MKRIYLMLFLTMSITAAWSQVYVDVAANYTMYKSDFQESTPGATVRLGYTVNEKFDASLGFTYGFPIKQASEVYAHAGMGNGIYVPSTINYNFKTFMLQGNYRFLGDEETAATVYGFAGMGLVLVNFQEKITGSYDQNAYPVVDGWFEKEKENGFTINFGAGASYKLGMPIVFAEAGVALPANQVNDSYVENVIPTHFRFNVGIRIPFGGNDYY